MDTIQRLTKARLKQIRKLLTRKGREEEGLFLVEGTRSVREVVDAGWYIEDACLTSDFMERSKNRSLVENLSTVAKRIWLTGEEELAAITDTVNAQGVVASVRMKKHKLTELFRDSRPEGIIILLVDVADPGNVGTILRTADWFGAEAVVCSGDTVNLTNPKVVRASMGAFIHLAAVEHPDAKEVITLARSNRFGVYATTVKGGKMMEQTRLMKKKLFVFGSEANGLPEEIVRLADDRITIPSFGHAESLNVSVSAGVILGLTRIMHKD